ncbi:MAG: rod-binding protein [Desulfomonilia bacterium]|jgi:Rod binding domain-containing protein
MIRGVTELYHLKQTNPDKALDLAGWEFESIFAHQLLKVMGESMPEGLFGDGLSSDIYQDMLFQAMARALADSGALGIGEAVGQHMKAVGMPGGQDE